MVKDHQKPALRSANGRIADRTQDCGRLQTEARTNGTCRPNRSLVSHWSGLLQDPNWRPGACCVTSWLTLALLTCGGCQSGLIDPGRSRGTGRPSQIISPAPGPQQPGSSGPITQGATPPDWAHVARQPATSVVQMSPADDMKAQYHTVQAGESWSSLARQNGVSVKQLADANGMDPSAILKTGQIVYIPPAGRRAAGP
ncbi:MAG: hypothetical protein JWM11_1035 [Planctomycetaceae bacterium]|nr:hypothetical protein [Planctomycetaceae bacterium]